MSVRQIELVSCHRMPERSFAWRGWQFPVCARCTGIILGWACYPLFLFGLAALPVWAALTLNVPVLLDGGTQAMGWRTSTNVLRLATGLLGGVGQVAIMAWLGTQAAHLILTVF